MNELLDDLYSEEEIKSMNYIKELLNHVKPFNLESEIIYYSLKYMKENPDLTINQAFALGYFEFIK